MTPIKWYMLTYSCEYIYSDVIPCTNLLSVLNIPFKKQNFALTIYKLEVE